MQNKPFKRCIFHIPNYLDHNLQTGSKIRPGKMLQAFRDNGYEVDYVMGYGKERKCQIERIKQNIRNNIHYDFMYSESSTMPTLLTEKDHFPRYPFLDFGFFKFCKRSGIKIGLFYRDIYWKFSIYKDVNLSKRLISIPLYKYDLFQYQRLLDKLYLPSLLMKDYVGLSIPTEALPPGCDFDESVLKRREVSNIQDTDSDANLFYVGGSGKLYNLKKLFRVVKKLEKVRLTVCCRETDWIENQEHYQDDMCERIRIIHESGERLKPYYEKADICMLFLESSEYRKFAMPVKLFEYISNCIPVIAVSGTAAGEFVEKEKIGWAIEYKEETLINLLKEIQSDRTHLYSKQKDIREALLMNTWEQRAKQVIDGLTAMK